MVVEIVSIRNMGFLDPFKHLFEVAVVKMNRYGTTVGAVKRILTLGKPVQECPGFPIVQVVVSLNRTFAAHHDGRLHPKLLDSQLAVLNDPINHFPDGILFLPLFKPGRV